MAAGPRNHRTLDWGVVSRARRGVAAEIHDNLAGEPHEGQHPSLRSFKLERYINDIRVRSFILTGAPISF